MNAMSIHSFICVRFVYVYLRGSKKTKGKKMKKENEMQQLHGIRYVQVNFFCTIIQLSWSILEKEGQRDMHKTNANKLLSVAFVVGDFQLVFSFVFLFHQFFGVYLEIVLCTICAFSSVQSHFFCLKQYTLNAQFYFLKEFCADTVRSTQYLVHMHNAHWLKIVLQRVAKKKWKT